MKNIVWILVVLLVGCVRSTTGTIPVETMKIGELAVAGDALLRPVGVSVEQEVPVVDTNGRWRAVDECLVLTINVTNTGSTSYYPAISVITVEDNIGRRLNNPILFNEGVGGSGALLAPGQSGDWLLVATPEGESDRISWTIRVVDSLGEFHTIHIHHRADEITISQ